MHTNNVTIVARQSAAQSVPLPIQSIDTNRAHKLGILNGELTYFYLYIFALNSRMNAWPKTIGMHWKHSKAQASLFILYVGIKYVVERHGMRSFRFRTHTHAISLLFSILSFSFCFALHSFQSRAIHLLQYENLLLLLLSLLLGVQRCRLLISLHSM